MNANGPVALWRRLTLWPRLALVLTLGFALLFAGFSLVGIRAVDESTHRILQERLAITEMLAQNFDGLLEHDFSDLAAFDPRGAGPAEQRLLLDEIYQHGSGEFATLSLLDGRGRVRETLGRGGAAQGSSLAAAAYVGRVLAGARHGISRPYRDGRGRPVVALAIGLRGGGVLVGTLDLAGDAVMRRLDAARRLGRTSHAELVGPGGVALASTEFADTLKPGEHVAFYRRMLASPTPGIADVASTPTPGSRDAMDGKRHVMAFARLRLAPWGVSLGGTDTDTYAPAQRLRRTLLLAGTSSLAALWLLTLLGARLLVRPVRTLTRDAEKMAAGNLHEPIRVDEGGEIGILADSLEAMREQLRDSLETVRRWSAELEDKVAERTAELNARNRQLAAVGAIMRAADEAHDLPGMLERCLDVVLEQTGMDAATIRLAGEGETPHAVRRGAWDDFPCADCVERMCVGATAAGHAACTAAGEAIAVLPLHGPNGDVGVLTIGRRDGRAPTPEEWPVLTAICDQIAVTVDNARLAGELRRLEARHETQRLRSELISAVSHELRTPLGFIKSYATTLLRDDAPIPPETRRQFLETIDEETDKLEHMIGELLDASRLQAGRLPMEREPVSLGALVARSVEKAQSSLTQGHEVTLALPPEDVRVLADALRIEQVLDNLLENAGRYSDPGSPIDVSVTVDHEEALLAVANRGNGLAEGELDQIFEPFYRGQNSKQRRIRGAGLGLAISRGIVDSHDGRIWAESTGGRTRFLFTLPVLGAPH